MNQDLMIDIADVMALALDTGLFVSLCTIQRPTGAIGNTGMPTGVYEDVPGLVGIRCMNAPDAVDRFSIVADEVKRATEVQSDSFRHVLLEAYYSELSPGTNWGEADWRAVVDGDVYDLVGAESDSQSQMVRWSLRLTNV